MNELTLPDSPSPGPTTGQASGEPFDTPTSARLPAADGGMVAGCAGKRVGIAQRRCMKDRLRLAAKVFDGTSEGIVVTDPQGRIVDVNAAFSGMTGYSRDEVLGRTAAFLSSGCHGKDFFHAMWDSLHRTGQWSGEICNRRATGELAIDMLRISAVHSASGEHTHYLGMFSDLSRLKHQQQYLEQLTHRDQLTGLPNRTQAHERLDQLTASARLGGQQFAVCYLDLDAFGETCNGIGHAQGDALLVTVAERLRQTVRASDTVARVGGDKFLLLLNNIADAGAVQVTLERVLQALAQPYASCIGVLPLTASVGMALYPQHGSMPEQLLRAADQAMYRAKRLGRNRTCMAGDDIEQSPAQKALLAELHAAMAADQLCLHYQPKVCARTRKALGVEALLRWQHPQRGLLAPGAFLPAVVGTPMEIALDLWVLRTAVAQLVRWRAAGLGLHVAINLSPATVALPELAGTVTGIVQAATGDQIVPLEGIELEVLETAALDDLDAASRAIQTCARHGISFALDDFGTGYSSLSYLRKLPVSTLKIDRSFVSSMLVDPGDLHIVRAVIGLARAFSVTTVAEGVETEEHARMLAELGCHQLQGFGIARPMPAQALEAWLDAAGNEKTRTAAQALPLPT